MRISLLICSLLLWVGCAQAAEVGIAAKVNEVEISNFRLERYFTEFLAAHGRSVAAIRDPRTYQRLRRAALDEMIDKELLCQEAANEGLKVDEEAVQLHFDRVRDAFGSHEDFVLRLEQAGFDETGYREYLRREQLSRRMLEKLTVVEPITDRELKTFLQQNTLPLAGSENRTEEERARQALLAQRQMEAARAVLQRLRQASRVQILAYGL